MCGIAGILRSDGGPVASAVIGEMISKLAHRGPDGSGLEARGALGIGHRRQVGQRLWRPERLPSGAGISAAVTLADVQDLSPMALAQRPYSPLWLLLVLAEWLRQNRAEVAW